MNVLAEEQVNTMKPMMNESWFSETYESLIQAQKRKQH